MSSHIEGCDATKIYVGIRPSGEADFESQAREIYRKLGALLRKHGASRRDVVSEKIFFSDLESQVEVLRQARAEFYAAEGGSLPATTYLEQPPCDSSVLCELQARVIFAQDSDAMTVREIEGLEPPAVGKVVSYRGYDHIYLHNLTGGEPGDAWSYEQQMQSAFDRAEAALEKEYLTFHDVIRTWIYLRDMDRDYDGLNRVRNEFFDLIGLRTKPASTGIRGGVYPCDRSGSMDLYALRTQRPVEIRLMHADSLNEAWSYGSAFARGMIATREDRSVLYLSGTASIDTKGQVVHVGDIEGQVNRMLLNIEKLLAGCGARPDDIVRATTYLKNPEHADIFRRIYSERRFPLDIPHTICHADVCRPEWLLETEVAAILPR